MQKNEHDASSAGYSRVSAGTKAYHGAKNATTRTPVRRHGLRIVFVAAAQTASPPAAPPTSSRRRVMRGACSPPRALSRGSSAGGGPGSPSGPSGPGPKVTSSTGGDACMALTGHQEAHELLLIEEADSWFEYLEATR